MGMTAARASLGRIHAGVSRALTSEPCVIGPAPIPWIRGRRRSRMPNVAVTRGVARSPAMSHRRVDGEQNSREGLHYLLKLVARTRLKSPHKALLRAVLVYANWRDGSGVSVSIARLASDMELGVRTVQGYLKTLAAEGIIRYDGDSRGGRRKGGIGRTNVFGVDVDRLRELAGESGQADNPAIGAQIPRSFQPPTPQITTKNPAESAGELLREQFKTNTTTTSASSQVTGRSEATSVSFGGGGGGDARSGADRGEPSGRSESVPAAEAEPVKRELLDFGISSKKAEELSHVVTLAQARAAINSVGPCHGEEDRRQGRVVRLLENPDARQRLTASCSASSGAPESRHRVEVRAAHARTLLPHLRMGIERQCVPDGDLKLKRIAEAWPTERHFAEDEDIPDWVLQGRTAFIHKVIDCLLEILDGRATNGGAGAVGESL